MELEKKKKEQKRLRNNIIICAVAYILILYLILMFTSYKNAYYKETVFEVFERMTNGISTEPLYFPGTFDGAFSLILYFTVFGAMILATTYAKSKLNKEVSLKPGGDNDFIKDLSKFNKKYRDDSNKKNMVMTKNVYISMDTRKTRRNNNLLVIGGSGAGKSRFLVKPNLCEMPINTSFVCTDPSGELLAETGVMLESNGYKIKVFNLVDIPRSYNYNPLKYINTETDVILLTDCILANTTDPNKKGGDDFWEKAQKLLFQAIIFLLWEHGDELRLPKNMASIKYLIAACQVNENSKSGEMNLFDKYFEAVAHLGWYFDESGAFCVPGEGGVNSLPERYKSVYHPPCEDGEADICYRQYKDFMMGAGKTLKSILISAAARLSVLSIDSILDLLSTDTMELDKIGDEKTALFIIIPQENDSFNFLAAMLYTQLFQELYFRAETQCRGNYVVQDSNGENVQIFEISHEEVEDDEEKLFEKAIKIDFNSHIFGLGNKKDKNNKNNKKDNKNKKDKKQHKINVSIVEEANRNYVDKDLIEIREYSDEELDMTKYVKRNFEQDDDDEKMTPDPIEKEVKNFIQNAKNVELIQPGPNKFIVQVPKNDKEYYTVGIYRSKEVAIERCKAIQTGCSYIRLKAYLPYHVRFLLDEFANVGQIPAFTKKLATMRKFEISCTIILQNLAQIKTMYKDDWGSISGNCDSFLFLGSSEPETLEYVSKLLGKKTQTQRSMSESAKGSSRNYQQNGTELMKSDQLFRLSNDECIYLLRGEQPIRDYKASFDSSIKNYKYTADADEKNTYKIKKRAKIYDKTALQVNSKPSFSLMDESSSYNDVRADAYTERELAQAKAEKNAADTNNSFTVVTELSEKASLLSKAIIDAKIPVDIIEEAIQDSLSPEEMSANMNKSTTSESLTGSSTSKGSSSSNSSGSSMTQF